jgi:hypothetical protein
MHKSNSIRTCRSLLSALLCAFTAIAVSADVTRIDIHERSILSAPDTALRYHVIEGVLHFSLNPDHPGDQKIVDIRLAPVNADGLVVYSTDFRLLVPDTAVASNTLLYSVNNRGVSRLPPEVSLTHPLAVAGHTYLVTGWINELPSAAGRLRLHAPIVGTTENPVTGDVRYEIIVNSQENDVNIAGAGHLAYTPTEDGLRMATMTRRARQADEPVVIERQLFTISVKHTEDANQPLVTVNLDGGFEPGLIYELSYQARDPVLAGAGLAAIRDIVALLRYGTDDVELRGQLEVLGLPSITDTIAWGYSQSGRLLRQFVYQGFNEDLQGNRVFDGVVPVIAGGGFGMFNMRFAMPTRTNGQHENFLYPNDFFPFTYGDSTDPLSGRTDGILRAARASGTEPKVMHIQTGNEYWIRGGSLPHTDPMGTQDAEIPDNVRFYTIGGSQHSGGDGMAGSASSGQLPANPNLWLPFAETLLAAMVDWVGSDREPPPSLYPRISNGTLVPSHLPGGEINPQAWQPLPGISHPSEMYQVAHVAFGADFFTKGVLTQPAGPVRYYRALLPAVGADNNELPAGTLLPPLTSVPLATFSSWNLRATATGADTALARLMGGYIPLPATEQDAERTGDHRPAIRALYNNFDEYLQAYRGATDKLIQQGYLSAEFRQLLLDIAEANRTIFPP